MSSVRDHVAADVDRQVRGLIKASYTCDEFSPRTRSEGQPS
jgi:hypothetical protein